MNVCKILDLTPGIEMTSWGTIHFPDEGRIMEWVVNVVRGKWRSLRYGACTRAPQGGFREIQESHRAYLDAFQDNEQAFKAQMICKEGLSEEEAIQLILGELPKAQFPHNLEKEAHALSALMDMCRQEVARPSGKRFHVEGRR